MHYFSLHSKFQHALLWKELDYFSSQMSSALQVILEFSSNSRLIPVLSFVSCLSLGEYLYCPRRISSAVKMGMFIILVL